MSKSIVPRRLSHPSAVFRSLVAIGLIAATLLPLRVTAQAPAQAPAAKGDAAKRDTVKSDTDKGDTGKGAVPKAPVTGEAPAREVLARGIVADVNGEPITYQQLERALTREINLQEITQNVDDARRVLRPQVLDALIIHRLELQQCELMKIEASDTEIDNFIRNRIEQLRRDHDLHIADIEDFYRQMLSHTGDTEAEIRQQMSEEIRKQKLLSSKVFKREYISPQQLRSFYKANREEFTTDTIHFVRFLIIPRDPQLSQILEQLDRDRANGKSFEELIEIYAPQQQRGAGAAEEISDDALDSYERPMPSVIRGLSVGEVSPRMDFPASIAFAKVEKRVAGKVLAFNTAECQEQIRKRIDHERRRRQYKKFRDELIESANIRRFLK